MRNDDGDLDYLVRAQPKVSPHSFEQAVREAYLLEHDCSDNKQMAVVRGGNKSRFTQIFGADPTTIQPKTIQTLLDPLKSRSNRRRIVRAWILECFGEDIDTLLRSPFVGTRSSEKTLRRVDRQIRQARLSSAAATALEAAGKTDDLALREQFLDRALFARQRLDEPGQAMRVARIIAELAERRGDRARLAAAHYYRARILLGLDSSEPEEIERILDVAGSLIREPEQPTAIDLPYAVANWEMLNRLRLAATLTFIERGVTPFDRAELHAMLEEVLARLKMKPPYQERFRNHQLAARINLLLGETFQAQEHVDKAFKSGEVKNLQAYEMCALLQGRILRELERPEKVSDYLQEVSVNCGTSFDRYHKRLAEYDLARVETTMFPPYN